MQNTTRKSGNLRPAFLKATPQQEAPPKSRSLNERPQWIRPRADPAIEAKLASSSSSSEDRQIGNKRTPLGIAPAAEQPSEGQALLLESLANLVQLNEEQKAALDNDQDLLQCLAQMPPGQLDRKENGFLKLAPPLALIHQLAKCGLGQSAGKLIGLCPKAHVIQLACDLLSDPTQRAGVPEKAIARCLDRAHTRLQHLAKHGLIDLDLDPQARKFQELAQGMLPGPQAPTLTFTALRAQARPELPIESGIDWVNLERAGDAEYLSAPSSFVDHDRDNRLARQAASKFKLLQVAFEKAGIPTDADRDRATKMLQGLCRSVALHNPGVLGKMEEFARKYDLLLDPAPSSKTFWTATFEKNVSFSLDQARDAMHTGTSQPPAIAKILANYPSASAPWLKMFRSLTNSLITQGGGAAAKEQWSAAYWKAVIPADLDTHAARDLQCDWPGFAAGDLKPGLDATGLDAEAFIYLQLQTPGADPKAKLAALYIAATIHGVHESPLLDFPPGTASLAFTSLLQTLSRSGEPDSGESGAQGPLSHLVMASGEGVKRFKDVLRVALTLAKQQDLSTAVDHICTESLPSDLRDALLRQLAAGGREYEVLVRAGAALSRMYEHDSDRGQILSEFFLNLGALYPLTSEIVRELADDKKKAGKQAGSGVENAMSAFVQGRLEYLARAARDNSSPQVTAAYWNDFGALLRAAKPGPLRAGGAVPGVLRPETYKNLKKLMPDS